VITKMRGVKIDEILLTKEKSIEQTDPVEGDEI
jgi:hypothetical protein